LLDRASAADLMQFATGDGRAAGHIGAVVVLDAAPGFSVAEARQVLGERIRAVPRRLDVVAADLAAIRDLGHTYGGTVNDVVLAAVAGALRTLLAARGEQLGEITITVPVAARRAASGGELGNQIGIMPVTVPAAGDFGTRATRTAEITRDRKSRARGASAVLFVPAFLLPARTGLLRWFASHQRVVQTFVTNLHGPEDPLTFGGAPVRAIIPIPPTTGNVTVTFAAASNAGTLRITILSDPARVPDAPALAAALRHELTAPLIAPPP
jgi:diacylglycerol O-acyltransferase / wax synthase